MLGMLRKLHKTLGKGQEGLAILEMALIMPLIIGFIMFIADMGLLFHDYVSASNALREGARCGVVGHDNAAVAVRVNEAAGFATPISVTSTRVDANNDGEIGIGDDLVVRGTFTHEYITPFFGGFADTEFDREVTMRLETDQTAATACGT